MIEPNALMLAKLADWLWSQKASPR